MRKHSHSQKFTRMIITKFSYFFIVLSINFLVEEALSNSIQPSQGIDIVLCTRCDAKCRRKISTEKILCIRSCLNSAWNKPGVCPSERKDNTSKLNCDHSCKSDIECSGISKCCQHSCGTICRTPIHLQNVSGLLPIPTNVTVSVDKTEFKEEAIQLTVQWSNTNSSFAEEETYYVVEESHHSGKIFVKTKLSDWSICNQTNDNKAKLKNLIRRGRWYLFRVTAINENGTQGPSTPTEPLFFSSKPKVPEAPENFTVGATSWGNGQFHLQLTWTKPESEIPITKYKITWSTPRNFTLIERHHTLPSVATSFWFHNLELNSEYFMQVQAQANYGARKLVGEYASITFHTANRTQATKLDQDSHKELKYKRHIKDFILEKLFWLHDQLLARISWKPIKKSPTNYSVSWTHDDCHGVNKSWYIAKTTMPYFEIYGLEPECSYSVSVKAMYHQSLYKGHKTFNTDNCARKNTTVLDNVITYCS